MVPDWRTQINGQCDGETPFTWLTDLTKVYILSGCLLLIFLVLPLAIILLYPFCSHRESSTSEKQEDSDQPVDMDDFWEKDGEYVYNVAAVLKPTSFIDDLLASNNYSEPHFSLPHHKAAGFKVDVDTQTDPVFLYDEQSTLDSSHIAMDNTPSSRGDKVHVVVNMPTQSSHSKHMMRPAKKLHRYNRVESKERQSAVHSKDRTATARVSTERVSTHYHRSSTARVPLTISAHPPDPMTRRSNESMRLNRTQHSSSIKARKKK